MGIGFTAKETLAPSKPKMTEYDANVIQQHATKLYAQARGSAEVRTQRLQIDGMITQHWKVRY